MAQGRARGFTLIELVISLTVLGILLTLGMPTFADWINNTKIRTAAEAITNGVQLARTEAVRTNSTQGVQFVLGGPTGPTEWTVNAIGGGGAVTQLQNRPVEGSGNAIVGVTPVGAATVTFSGLGRILPNGDGSASLTQIDVCSTASFTSTVRKMRVTIGTGGNIKMCDSQVPSTDPRGCPTVAASAC